MSRWTPLIDENWPTPDHQLVLRAALLDQEDAEAAWTQWLAIHDIGDVDLATYFLFPTLYHNLKRLGIEGPVVTKLSGVYRFTWAKNLVAQQSLAEVVRLLNAEAIPVVALKGAALLERHYGDPGARMMNDIDVLVREADALRSLDALQEAGWTPDMPVPRPTHLAFTHAQAVTHPTFVEADLHWRPFLIDAPLAAEEALFERTSTDPALGARVPDATDLLMMVCVHSRKPDMHSACRWVADAVTIVSTSSIEWERLSANAREMGVLLPLRDALTTVHGLFPKTIPEDALAAMWAVPATSEMEQNYHQLRHESRAYRRLRDLAATHWWRYSRGSRSRGLRRTLHGVLRYGLEHYRRVWNLGSAREVPGYALAELGRHAKRVVREGGPTRDGRIELATPEAG